MTWRVLCGFRSCRRICTWTNLTGRVRFVPSIHVIDFVTISRCAKTHRPRPPEQGGRRELAHRIFQPFGHSFAVGVGVCGNRLAVAHHRVHGAANDELLDVRDEVEITIPGDYRPVLPPHRNAVLTYVAYRHRLNEDATLGPRAGLLKGSDQRGAERQHAVAVV